jgi:hypothetical protein
MLLSFFSLSPSSPPPSSSSVFILETGKEEYSHKRYLKAKWVRHRVACSKLVLLRSIYFSRYANLLNSTTRALTPPYTLK